MFSSRPLHRPSLAGLGLFCIACSTLEVDERQVLLEIRAEPSGVIALSADGRRLAVPYRNATVVVWDVDALTAQD